MQSATDCWRFYETSQPIVISTLHVVDHCLTITFYVYVCVPWHAHTDTHTHIHTYIQRAIQVIEFKFFTKIFVIKKIMTVGPSETGLDFGQWRKQHLVFLMRILATDHCRHWVQRWCPSFPTTCLVWIRVSPLM